nr:B-cell lymphoma 3 protein [Anolis sagrei ordinatus]
MAGELPVDLRTWRKSGGGGGGGGGEGPQKEEEEEEKGPPKAQTCLPLRKRRYAQGGPQGEEARGPPAGQVPKREEEAPGGRWAAHGAHGLGGPFLPLPYPRLPHAYFSGLSGSFLGPELTPILHSVTPPHPFLGVPTPYSLLCSVEAQLALDIATATKQDEDGDTPLHIAVVQGNLSVVQRLVALFHQGHRDLDTFNNLRQTPLHLAVITGQPALAKVLLTHGASPMVLDRHGQTALHLACEHGSLRCLRELLEGSLAPLDLEARNFEGLTPLHVAVGTSDHNMVLALLEHGADVDAVDIKSGRSPLLHAVENNNLEMVELLLKHGANVNAQSYGGNTALHAASGRGLLDTLRLLVRNGADGSLKNYHNDTPLMVAKNKRVIDILRGKASRSGPAPDNSQDGSSPTNGTDRSPILRPTYTGLLRSSPDSCPTTPSPARTPKPLVSANQKPESIMSSSESLGTTHLQGVKPERSPSPPAAEQPMGFRGPPKYFLPVTEGMMDPAFSLYPFVSSGHGLSPHPLPLIPFGVNPSLLAVSSESLANQVQPRSIGADQSQEPLDSPGPWPCPRGSDPRGS